AELPIDLMSLASHKTYGPKGIGALYVRRKPRVRLEAQMHGGGHERGMRSGTLPTHQCVGMGAAFRIAREEMGTENERIRMLQQRLLAGLKDMEQVFINGDLERRVPDELAHSSLRITIGRFTTEQEIDEAVALLRDRVAKLRELSPLWEMYKDGVDLSTIQWAAH
ncbi:MAG: aminotransferase class V-fold PLP-dependent enzyme, partial [Betaproteobacteria bacterium]|nr:aminotransferase class V-fold PLP-dependent enzyme [Betaproteobacteria bacterium]